MLSRNRSRASPKAVSISLRLPRLPPSPNATTDARGEAALEDGSVFVVDVLYLFDLGGRELRRLGLAPPPRCLGGGRGLGLRGILLIGSALGTDRLVLAEVVELGRAVVARVL